MKSDIRLKQATRRRESVVRKPDRKPASPADLYIGPSDLSVTYAPRSRHALLKRVAWTAVAVLAVAVLGVRAQGTGTEIKNEITASVEVTKQAFGEAKGKLAAGDLEGAEQQFGVAETALHGANLALAKRGQIGNLPAGQASGTLATGEELLATGESLTASSRHLLSEVRSLSDRATTGDGGLYKSGELLVRELPHLESNLGEIDHKLALLTYLGARASRSGNPELAAAGKQFSTILPSARDTVKQARQVTRTLGPALGEDHFKRYLVLFQNPDELRATGGFIGTYGRIKLDDGALKELSVDSIYGPANQANGITKEAAPTPYERFNEANAHPIWAMQDANWSPDFATTARKFQTFYERSGGPTTDGVIGLTTAPIIEVLKITGPINLPAYNYTLSADNFRQTLEADQYSRSLAADTDPKKVLRDFVPALLARIGQLDAAGRQQVYRVIGDAVSRRELMAYAANADFQKLVSAAKLDGALPTGDDTLSVVDTNIGGRKSSADITSTLARRITIGADGQATVQLALTRRYSGHTSQDPNSNYTRFYLPLGSKVSDPSGWHDYGPVTTDEQDGFTVVGGWTDVAPGEERTVSVSYVLPARVTLGAGSLPLSYRKQPGTALQVLTDVVLPAGYAWVGTQSAVISGQTLHLDQTSQTDLVQTLTFTSG